MSTKSALKWSVAGFGALAMAAAACSHGFGAKEPQTPAPESAASAPATQPVLSDAVQDVQTPGRDDSRPGASQPYGPDAEHV